MTAERDDQRAFAGALAGLPGIGPATLQRLLHGSTPAEAWQQIRHGVVTRPAGPGRARGVPDWGDHAARVDPFADAARWRAAGIGVTWLGDDLYPDRLRRDLQPPGVLFWRGDLGRLGGRTVAVVGTRRCSPEGRTTAYHLGRDLAAAGVCVVSGLALGIDGAAHTGAIDHGPPPAGAPGSTAGVAASGVDVVYPPRHRELWSAVATSGILLSETPPGRPAQAWRFPSRNRVIAALAELVVVVESHTGGGSQLTAEAALDRGIDVRAVPGPVGSPASAGTNQLLYDGAGPVRDATDVLDALGVIETGPRRAGRRAAPRPSRVRTGPARPPAATSASVVASATSAASAMSAASATSETAAAASPAALSAAAPPSLFGDAVDSCATPAPAAASPRPTPSPSDALVLEAVGWRPTSLAAVVRRAAVPLAVAASALDTLHAAGLVREDGGWWTRR